MCKKPHNVFDDQLRNVNNDIRKPYKVRILKYTECVREMFELAQDLSLHRKKGDDYHEDDWIEQYIFFREIYLKGHQ